MASRQPLLCNLENRTVARAIGSQAARRKKRVVESSGNNHF